MENMNLEQQVKLTNRKVGETKSYSRATKKKKKKKNKDFNKTV